jgi:hypothetical protein
MDNTAHGSGMGAGYRVIQHNEASFTLLTSTAGGDSTK